MAPEQAQEPFLKPDEKDTTSIIEHAGKPLRQRRSFKCEIITHLVLIAIYISLSAWAVKSLTSSTSDAPKKILDDLAISYESVLFKNLTNNPFAGPPTSEIDATWDDLLSSMNIRVSDQELGGKASVPLPDGGRLAWLSVSHNVHCLNLMRKWHFREHYFPELEPGSAAEEHQASHVLHCIERLRQAVLCQADIASLTVFKWSPKTPKPMFDNTEQTHQCVDWDRLMGSVQDRVVGDEEWDRLRNPLLEHRDRL